MSRRAGLWVCLIVAAVLAPAASAQNGGSFVLFGLLTGSSPRQQAIPAHVTGELDIAFHGDQATGCAARGLCGYSGTVVVRPSSQGQLSIETVGGGHADQVALVLGGAVTGSQVSRSGGAGQAGRCADEAQTAADLTLQVKGGNVTLDLLAAGGSLLVTRCAGPLDGDLSAAGPSTTVALSELRKGQMTLDLSGSRSFASGGLAGAVSSTIKIALGKPSQTKGLLSGLPKRLKLKRFRLVTEHLGITRVSGQLSAAVRGANDGTCAPLDSCGLAGTLTVSPGAGGTATLIAIGRATIGYPRFIAALRGQRVPGIAVEGSVDLSPGGAVTTTLAGSGQSCSDTAPAPREALLLRAQSRKLTAALISPSPPRARCPGPLLSRQLTPLAAGEGSGSMLAQRSFVLTVRAAGASTDDGYNTTLRGTVRVALRRGEITQQVLRLPAG